MEQIRYVKIPLAETRTDPDTHVEYALNVQGPVRSWTVWHRYNDFLTLAYELNREFPNTPTPLQLPPKTLTSWFSKITTFIEERRHALERYIQGMIMSEDGRWRESASLQRFLAPMSTRTGSETGSADSDMGWVTPASWLNEHRDAEQIVRDVRQSILRRENALTRNEVSVSHQSLLQAKRQLADLGRVLKVLEQGLEQTKGGLTAGEVLRRQDMVMRLVEERANLSRIVMGTSAMSGSGERAALLSGTSLDNNNNTRVLGRAGNETNETRGLDNKGLLMLQTDRMREQDQVAADFSALLQRQREMGVAIGNELDLQNQLLTELDQDMDRTGNKISTARRQANRFT
ncbi:Phox homologous domain-containing protein [Kickxella alabastrina]|uniref:Phox homologous domain-containing protein n=1 Tax=Kickxella alabastrina TaxID=61397 RepID=UPI00221FCBF5|nr:Phox homologous domain-containing protein [Kickxella alabastrina]KAI7833197.1 Phox homologous domain-containing protein [Kickxella alabastrina]